MDDRRRLSGARRRPVEHVSLRSFLSVFLRGSSGARRRRLWDQVYAASKERVVTRMMPLGRDLLLVATESLDPPLHSRIERIKMRAMP